jgi:hypothetical protein
LREGRANVPALSAFRFAPDAMLAAALWQGSRPKQETETPMFTPAMREIAVFLDALDGVVRKESWGEIAWFHNPGAMFASGAYVATVKLRDGPNDRASNLEGDGAHRLNFAMERTEFVGMFGSPPVRPAKGQAITGSWDLRARKVLMPHPVYGWMCWASIIDPDMESVGRLKPLLAAAHRRAQLAHARRVNRKGAPLLPHIRT